MFRIYSPENVFPKPCILYITCFFLSEMGATTNFSPKALLRGECY